MGASPPVRPSSLEATLPPCDVRFVANRYDKREELRPESPEVKAYSHLLMEANATKVKLLRDSHQPLAFTEGYGSVAFDPLGFPPLSVRLERKAVLMERKAGARQPKQRA